ncbi:MAG: hypothetical protein RL153_2411 [Verrucomicrobiota bacterium]
MRREGRVMERVAAWENLRLAFGLASRGKRGRREVMEFEARLDERLGTMSDELREERVVWGGYRRFKVWDPKERQICAPPFRDRVLHHALMAVCGPVLDRALIHHTYACREGKGVHAALEAAEANARRHGWHVKLDVRRYFDSIEHGRLIKMLERRFKEWNVLSLFWSILETYQTSPGRGLPIGSLTSQWLANLYLDPLDRMVTETLRCPGYVRYMDDFVLWGDTRDEVRGWRGEVESFLRERLGLELKERTPVQPTGHGLPFLGFRLFPHRRRRLERRSRDRFERGWRAARRAFEEGRLGEREYQQRLEALFGWVSHAETSALRRALLERLGDVAE